MFGTKTIDINESDNNKITVGIIGDSPAKHTGFGQVVKQFADGLHEAGMNVHVLCLLDRHASDYQGDFPYRLWDVPAFDDLAHENWTRFVRIVRPHVLLFITDPGNLWFYFQDIMREKGGRGYEKIQFVKHGNPNFIPNIVSYTPIEGKDVEDGHIMALELVDQTGGIPVVYNDFARQVVAKKSVIDVRVVPHGLDHAEFRPYSDEEKRVLRELVGWDKYFVVGFGGVNKRIKRLDVALHTARALKDKNLHEGIVFYVHTNPDNPTMNGYKLREIARDLDVLDMVFFKNVDGASSYWIGKERDGRAVEQAMQIAGQVPDTPEKRGFLWGTYDFISMLNCFDIFVDTSSIEGWGFWPGEAMACGVPTLIIDDRGNRRSIYKDGPYWIPTVDPDLWPTWDNSARLAIAHPKVIASSILDFKNDLKMRRGYAKSGLRVANQYKWGPPKKAIVAIVREAYNRDWGQPQETIDPLKTIELRVR